MSRDIEALSRIHFCLDKIINITYSECACSLSYTAHKAHALCYFVIYGLCGSTVCFQHCLINSVVSGKRLLDVKCLFFFIFSTNFI